MFQDENPENFSLIEVSLDKGVTERMLELNEKPWQLMQESRKVSYL